MRTTAYPLKQSQYAKIYQASERTVRTWMKKGAPLDDPHEMIESFLQNQRTTVPGQKLAELVTLQASYQREVDPAAERAAVRAELGERIAEIDAVLGFARDFARKHEPANWQQFVERCRVIAGEIDRLYELAGIGEDYDHPEPTRPDLAKPVVWNWVEDREAIGKLKAVATVTED